MQLLTTFVGFFRSRQKLLIKRRKIAIKNRPISSKKLKQQQKVMNISYQTKLVEIKKQLDRKKSQNHHINEIIEDLFYPQMRLQNEQQVEMRVKQMNNDSAILGEDWEEELKLDELTQQIRGSYLPVDLLNLHEEKWEEFTQNHYEELMEKMNHYCYNREKIKKKMMDHWEKLIKKMQEKEGKSKPVKCPYLFLERQQITRHEHWTSMMQQIHKKMLDIKDIQAFNEYLPTLFLIKKTFGLIPIDIYQLVFTKNALTNFQDLTPAHVSSLMKLLRYRNRVKYDPLIKISPQQEQQQAGISHFARKLATEIINNPQHYTKHDFMNIFIVVNSDKKKFSILTQELLTKSENIASSILNGLSFQNVLTYMSVYAIFNGKPNFEFLQILKFDLYRKCDTQINYFPLLVLINHIRQRRLTFRKFNASIDRKQNQISLEGFDLLIKATEAISKLISKLKSEQLVSLLNTCFGNDLYQHTPIEIISTEFVKKGKEYDLETLGKGFFKISLLGHRSKILSKYVFDQYVKNYHDQVKKYKEEENLLLPTQGNVYSAPGPNNKVVYLQQCLLMTIWGVIHHLGANLKSQINLENMLTLIPVQMESTDLLALDLASNINQKLKHYAFFPKIQAKTTLQTTPESRHDQIYRRFSKNQHKNPKKTVEEKKIEKNLYDLSL